MSRPVVTLAALGALSSTSALAQSISPIERAAGACVSCAVDGWTVRTQSPDVILGNGPWPGGGWVVSDVNGGPREGSTMQLSLSASGVFETTTTTATGLTPGRQYAVSVWYQAMTLTYSGVGTYVGGAARVTIDGDVTVLPESEDWTQAVVPFTAGSTTAVVDLGINDLGSGSLGGGIVFDDIEIVEPCDLDQDGEAAVGGQCGGTDCDDSDPSVNTAADEVCGGVDEDCSGAEDDNAVDAAVWFADSDEDGFGDAESTMLACAQPDGFLGDSSDCDDSDDSTYPGATELCDGHDDDCDGAVDEADAADAATWYADADGDTFGDADTVAQACDQPTDFVSDATDCDDAAAAVNPDATEVCNSIDDDCDGTTDLAAVDMLTWYADADDDGYGAADVTAEACEQPSGYESDNTDCDDAVATTYPGAVDAPYDGVDADCAGDSDFDADGDGYESADHGGDDCDDADTTVYPGAPELEDGLDNDCNGLTELTDTDGDGVPDEEELDLGTDPELADSDGDGVRDGDELGSGDEPADTDEDGTIDALDDDDDGDGIPTADEVADYDAADPDSTLPDTDGDGTPDHLDEDADGDGVSDADEGTGDVDCDGIANWVDADDVDGSCDTGDGGDTGDTGDTGDSGLVGDSGDTGQGLIDDTALDETPERCGCASGAPGSLSWLLLPALLLVRRRQGR